MGIPTPFHSKTTDACKSLKWKEWAGYFAVDKYDPVHDNEYYAFRQTAGLLDVSPLYKYDVKGPDALKLMNRVMARDVKKVKVGQVAYSCWCDEQGKAIDDGTLWRLDEDHFFVTSANPSLRWFTDNAVGMKVSVEDASESWAALALQGPKALDVLLQVTDGSIETLKFFHLMEARIGGVKAYITRTGYTGDLGYEIWVAPRDSEKLWDVLMEGGRDHGLMPAGLLALDMTRIEAGFVLIDVDYTSAHHALIESQKSSPYEIGLGWTVHLEKDRFIGQAALVQEKQKGSPLSLVGLEIDIEELEVHYDALGLPVTLPMTAWRSVVPVYDGLLGSRPGRQVGRATSGVWSPLLKKNLALATVESRYAAVGTKLKIEVIVEYDRKYITATVVPRPFFDPPRKKAVVKKATPRELQPAQ